MFGPTPNGPPPEWSTVWKRPLPWIRGLALSIALQGAAHGFAAGEIKLFGRCFPSTAG